MTRLRGIRKPCFLIEWVLQFVLGRGIIKQTATSDFMMGEVMKKKLVLTTTIILIICLSITALSGCLLFGNNDKDEDERPRHATLGLYKVYQSLTSGNIIFVIANKEALNSSDKLEVSFNGGIDWRMARGNCIEWYCSLEDVELGAHDIVVRIAEDDKNRESKTSNTIRYTVKSLNDFKSENMCGQVLLLTKSLA